MNNNSISLSADSATISTYFRTVSDQWRISSGRNWHKVPRTFYRVVWLACADIAKLDQGREPTEEERKKLIEHIHMLWWASTSMVVENVLDNNNGEYNLAVIHDIVIQFEQYWNSVPDNALFMDALETIVLDIVANQQINVTCVRVLCNGLKLSLNDLCVLPEAITKLH